MIKNKMLKRILAFALCALLTAGMTPESILAAEAGESTEESAGISGNEAAKEPVSDNKTDPDTGELTPGGEGMTPSENEATEPIEDPSGIPEEIMPTETVSEDEAEGTVSEDSAGECVSENEASEVVSGNETVEAAGAIPFKSMNSIPATEVSEPVESIDLTKYINGGTAPYTFTKESGPNWLYLSEYGLITGVPIEVADSNDPLVIKVTDSEGDTGTITIPVGKNNAPKNGFAINAAIWNNAANPSSADPSKILGLYYDVSGIRQYWKNGGTEATNDSNGWNAHFEYGKGKLTLNNYTGTGVNNAIAFGGPKGSVGSFLARTTGSSILYLQGTNTINIDKSATNEAFVAGLTGAAGGNLVITGGNNATLNITVKGSGSPRSANSQAFVRGIATTGNWNQQYGTELINSVGKIIIAGKINVNINVTSDSALQENYVSGIYSGEGIYVLGGASVNVNAKGNCNFKPNRTTALRGYAGGKFVAATEGDIILSAREYGDSGNAGSENNCCNAVGPGLDPDIIDVERYEGRYMSYYSFTMKDYFPESSFMLNDNVPVDPNKHGHSVDRKNGVEVIARWKTATPPTGISGSPKTYNGSEQTVSLTGGGGSGYTITGDKGTNAGKYTAKAVLKPGYIWSDGTRNDKSYEWRINPCRIEIENKVYSKNYGEPDPVYNYEARVDTTSLDEEAKQRVLNEFNRIVKGSLSRDPGEEIGGNYLMQLGTLSGGINFTLYLSGSGKRFWINKAPAPAHVTVTREIIAGSGNITVRDLGGYMPYDDEVFQFIAKSKDQATITGTANITELSTINKRDVVLKYTGATAGTTISVPVDVKSNHYNDSTLTILYTVRDRNIIPVTVSQASITYGEKELPRVEFDWEGMTSSEKNNANVTYGGNTLKGGVYGPFTQTNWGRLENSPKDAGNYIVSINYAPQGSDKSYEGSEAFRISPRTLSANEVRTGYTKVYTYDGTDQLPAQNELKVSAYIPRDKKYTELDAGEDYELYDGQTKRKDAGTYELLYKGKGNFKSGVLSAEWEIDRAVPGKLHFESVTETRTYNAQPQIVSAPDLKNSYTGAGRAAVLYEGTGDTVYEESSHAPSDAGTYRINLDLSEGDNFKAGKVEDVGTLTIKKASRGEVQAECFGQPGIEAGADLSAYIGKGGSLGNPEITDGSEYLVGGVRSEEGKILKFKFREGAVSDNTVSVKIPVNGSVNYDTYNLVVTLTPEDHKHKFVRIPAVAPTCTTMGNIEYYTCEICGRSYLDETGAVLAGSVSLPIDPDAHDWGEWVVTKEPTKREAGQRKKECLRCHKTIVEEIPMVAVPSYSVAFSLNGKPGTAPAAQDILQGDPVAKPVDPSADGFIFLGWFTDTAGEDYFDFNTPVNSDLTLYAKWAAKDVKIFTVTFDLNGRSGTAPAAQKVAEGGMAGIPKNPTSAGFIFRGWYTDKDCKSLYDFSDPVTADLTLYARWEEDVPPGAFKIFYTDSALAFDSYKGLTYNTENEHYEWTYTGSALKPVVTVTDYKGNVLSEGSDYTVKYTGNKDVSAKPAKVTVTGRGNYSGSKSLDFYILKADLAKAKAKKLLVVPDSFAVQKGKKISPVVIYQGITLDAKKDYKLSNTGAIKEDTTVDIEGKGTFFTGKISGIPVKALSAEEVKNNTIKVSLSPEKHVYTGSAQELSDKELVVKAGSSTSPLAKGKDYKVIYSKNTDAGKVKVTVMALGSYIGNVSKTFTIEADTKSNITAALKEGTSTGYDPKGATPALNVKTDKTTLKAGKDYKVTYSNNKSKGEADYKLTFIGNFKGHKAVTGKFTITEGAFASASVNSADLIYGKPNLYRSVPFVSIGGVSVGKKDYTVKYFDGTKELGEKEKITLDAGQTEKTITVKATGKNNYKAEDSAAFTYRVIKVSGNMINLSKAKIVGKDTTKGVKAQEYTGEYVTPEIDVLVKQGKTWVKTDPANYTVTYINNINKGKAVIMVTGKGGAAGSKTAKFTIKAKSMSKFNK